MHYNTFDSAGQPVTHAWGSPWDRVLVVRGEQAWVYDRRPAGTRSNREWRWSWTPVAIRSVLWWDIHPVDKLADDEVEAWLEHLDRATKP